jgi:hypothetical protein
MYARGYDFLRLIYTGLSPQVSNKEEKLMPALKNDRGAGEKAADAIER